MIEQSSLTSFLVILIIVAISPFIARRIRIPTIVLEVAIGLLLGKSFLNFIREDQWIEFFSFIGLIYLLFLGGLEINIHEYLKNKMAATIIALASLLIPFLLGYWLGETIGVYPILLGTILSTTSLGIVIPLTREIKDRPRFTTLLLASTMLVDIVSMLLLTASIQTASNPQAVRFIYSYAIFGLLLLIPFIIRHFKITRCISEWFEELSHLQLEVRICFALIAAFALLAEFIGVEAILGAFLSGLIISELTHRGSLLEQKMMGFGYGFFVPFFFIIVGATIDLNFLVKEISNISLLVILLILGIGGKVLGASIAGKIVGFTSRESLSLGFIESARLSLVLAGATIARSAGLINDTLYSILVLFAMITVIVGPSLGMIFLKKPSEYHLHIPEIQAGSWSSEEES
ncbi:cation:proton antiporter [Thermoproteota archaeon]